MRFSWLVIKFKKLLSFRAIFWNLLGSLKEFSILSIYYSVNYNYRITFVRFFINDLFVLRFFRASNSSFDRCWDILLQTRHTFAKVQKEGNGISLVFVFIKSKSSVERTWRLRNLYKIIENWQGNQHDEFFRMEC